MSAKRWVSIALSVTVVCVGVVTTDAAQSVYPVRFDDDEAVREESVNGAEAPLGVDSGASAITVEGEVLTVDPSGEPRLWGRGRPGTAVYLSTATGTARLCSNGPVKLGLSAHVVDWGSAADACPAGFWVCTVQERGTDDCDTLRGDESVDGFDCAGGYLDWTSGNHLGWTANGSLSGGLSGIAVGEKYFPGAFSRQTCISLPVWCCME
jgi:hypothetical protein